MMCFGITFYIVLCLTLQGPALSKVWVNHWSTEGQYGVGDTATLHCAIFSDNVTIENCDTDWVMLDPNKPGRTFNIMESELYAGRVEVQNKKNTASITIRNLGLNDTAPLCKMDCFLDGRLARNIGKGGRLKIVEPSDPQEEEPRPSLTWLNYFLFAINILIFLVVTVLCSTVLCRRLHRK